jgi:hypothetical protein
LTLLPGEIFPAANVALEWVRLQWLEAVEILGLAFLAVAITILLILGARRFAFDTQREACARCAVRRAPGACRLLGVGQSVR